jgi:succinoglycan biosynthesis protein ExoA
MNNVSIIIPCRNEARTIAACLRDVLAFESPPGGFEVLVVDGMSTDGTREIVAKIGSADERVRRLDNPEGTTSHALNIGIRAARGEVIVRVDAHTEYASDYLTQCLVAMTSTQADNVGGPALTKSSSYLHRAIAAAYHSRFAVGNSRLHQPDYEGWSESVPYGCYRRSTLLQLGLFDEELVRNQDDELNYRLIRAGGRIWQTPKIRSWYSPRPTLSQLFQQYFQYGYWKVRVIQKHRLPASWRHVVPGGFVFTLLVLALFAPFLPLAIWGLAGVGSLYAGVLLAGALLTARGSGLALFPMLPIVLASYHLGYGLGFLLGIWDFVLRPHGHRYHCMELTR